jgi:hypothetical protein
LHLDGKVFGKRILIALIASVIFFCIFFAINLTVTEIIIEILRSLLGTFIVFGNTPLIIGFLGLSAIPYTLIYIPISIFRAYFKEMSSDEVDFSFYFRRKGFYIRMLIGCILWILLFTTGVYTA